MQKVAAALREATDILKELVEMSIASDPEAVYAASNLVQELARLQVVLAKEEAAVCNAEIAVDSGQERAGADCGSSSPGTVTGGAE